MAVPSVTWKSVLHSWGQFKSFVIEVFFGSQMRVCISLFTSNLESWTLLHSGLIISRHPPPPSNFKDILPLRTLEFYFKKGGGWILKYGKHVGTASKEKQSIMNVICLRQPWAERLWTICRLILVVMCLRTRRQLTPVPFITSEASFIWKCWWALQRKKEIGERSGDHLELGSRSQKWCFYIFHTCKLKNPLTLSHSYGGNIKLWGFSVCLL